MQYAYDADGNVVSVTPPSGPPHQFIYTASAQLQSYQPPVLPGAGSTSYEYDLDHHLKTVYRPDGSTVNVTYDAAGRPSGVAQSGGAVSYTYDTAGRVATMVGPAGESLTYGYDGELVTSVAFTGPVAGTVQRSFDNFFRLASESVTGGQSIAYQYDGDGLLTGAGALTVSRDARNGLVTGTVVGNFADVVSSNEYGEATGYTASYNGGAQPLYGVQYVRDGLGRIVQKSESYGGTTDSYRYVYDAPGRLTDVEKNGVAVSHYEYDAHGNRASAQTGGMVASGSYDAQDRLVSYGGASYAYTANGEVASRTSGGGTTSYHYDGMGRLVGVDLPDGTVVSYLLDGRGRRVGKRVNGTLVQGLLYRSELAPIAELDGAGQLVSQFVYGRRVNVPDYILKNGSTYRVITDQLGSPRLVVDVATGAVVQKVDYDEFGGVVQDTNPGFQPFGFAGGLYDRDTKLVHFGAREYDAVTGRWLAKDPLLFGGGDTNLYAYALTDPVNVTDVNGTEISLLYSKIVIPNSNDLQDPSWSGQTSAKPSTISCQCERRGGGTWELEAVVEVPIVVLYRGNGLELSGDLPVGATIAEHEQMHVIDYMVGYNAFIAQFQVHYKSRRKCEKVRKNFRTTFLNLWGELSQHTRMWDKHPY